jgi:hypothetical protein
MMDRNAGGDAAASLVERRWFAFIAAARAMRAECEVLREVVMLAEDSWRRACRQLARLEGLRDALGEELADAEGLRWQQNAPAKIDREMSSAA